MVFHILMLKQESILVSKRMFEASEMSVVGEVVYKDKTIFIKDDTLDGVENGIHSLGNTKPEEIFIDVKGYEEELYKREQAQWLKRHYQD